MKHLKLFEDFSEPTGLLKPPSWVKNPAVWAMDKIIELLTPETNIDLIVSHYRFENIESNQIKTIINSIYQSCKSKKELDVKDHVRRLQNSFTYKDRLTDKKRLANMAEVLKDPESGSETVLLYKFETLLTYFL